jgi:hypothetical protein
MAFKEVLEEHWLAGAKAAAEPASIAATAAEKVFMVIVSFLLRITSSKQRG